MEMHVFADLMVQVHPSVLLTPVHHFSEVTNRRGQTPESDVISLQTHIFQSEPPSGFSLLGSVRYFQKMESFKSSSQKKRTVEENSSIQKIVPEEIIKDIMIQILLRLPVKTLGRFKCVSKEWYHFISHDPSFRKSYKDVGGYAVMVGLFFQRYVRLEYPVSERSMNDKPIRFMPTSKEGRLVRKADISLSFLRDHNNKFLHMVASSNGFLLCTRENIKPLNYYICNPVTKKRISLPIPNKTRDVVLAGFTCQERFNHLHYKVVRAILTRPLRSFNDLTFEIFCSDDEMHQWKEFNLTYPHKFRIDSKTPEIITSEAGVAYMLVSPCGLLVFDKKQEDASQLEIIELPTEVDEEAEYYQHCLAHTNGLIVYTLCVDNDSLSMWVLDEHTKEWSLKYEVTNLGIPREYRGVVGDYGSYFKIKAIHPLHPHLLLLHMWDRNRSEAKVAWYNVESLELVLVPMAQDYVSMFGKFLLPCMSPSWPPSSLLFK